MASDPQSPVALDDLLRATRSNLRRVRPQDLREELDAGALLIDVRDSAQRDRDGEMPGAIPIDLTILEWRLAPTSSSRQFDLAPEHRVILVCNQGYSSSLAAGRLQRLGLPNATDLVGGFTAWSRWRDRAES
jgi:rhodanese-related sulfurtransferase